MSAKHAFSILWEVGLVNILLSLQKKMEKAPLLVSQDHKEHGQSGKRIGRRRSLAAWTGSCVLTTVTLPLRLFRRTKNDEVMTIATVLRVACR